MIPISTIADLGEFGLISVIKEQLELAAASSPATSPDLILGVGDDAAVVRAPDGRVVATTDLLIEDRHFRRAWSSARDVGHKAAARNLADVAAMGGRATALLLGLAVPGDLEVSWVAELVQGMAAECSATGARIAGGDTSGCDRIMLAITALGDLDGRLPVTRSGARPGDVLACAGNLGGAAAGLDLLTAGIAPGPAGLDGLVAAQRRPRPPYAAGPGAAIAGATSMIDISDGLIADLGHVARESRVRIELATGQLSAHPGVDAGQLAEAAALLGRESWLPWVLTGGEDHALAATFPAGVAPPAGWREIGGVTAGSGVIVDGRPWSGAGGWDHFRSHPPGPSRIDDQDTTLRG